MAILNPNNPNANIDEQQQLLQFAKVLKTAPDMECDVCGHKYFVIVHRIKKISGLVTGTGRDMIAPISLYACSKCGNVNKYFLDKFNEEGEEK